jgi:hypothetical protein
MFRVYQISPRHSGGVAFDHITKELVQFYPLIHYVPGYPGV